MLGVWLLIEVMFPEFLFTESVNCAKLVSDEGSSRLFVLGERLMDCLDKSGFFGYAY